MLRRFLNFVRRVARAFPKSMPPALLGGQWTGTGFVDAYKRNRNRTKSTKRIVPLLLPTPVE